MPKGAQHIFHKINIHILQFGEEEREREITGEIGEKFPTGEEIPLQL